jgi:putative transposase
MAAPDPYASLKMRIQTIYDHHAGRYGYRRIMLELRREGLVINHKLVQRLMQAMGLKSRVRPKKYNAFRDKGNVANLLNQQFHADRPNQVWVTDVTEFKIGNEKLYLSPIMDLYNGEIVVFEMSRRPTSRLVDQMLSKALRTLPADEKPLLHSDQGWHYRRPAYRRALAEHGLIQSMSDKGNCYDNAPMESFFGTLKSEFFYLTKFQTIEQLRDGIRRFIHYYNHQRIRLVLNGLSPVEYRAQAFGA